MQLRYILIIFFLIAAAAGCQSAKKSLRSGEYDRAVYTAVKKLRKNPDKEKHIVVLEQAFKKANERDLKRIEYLKKEGTPDIWVEVFALYEQIHHRQELIKPLLPLRIPTWERNAKFDFVDYENELIAAKKKAAEYLYAHAIKLLESNGRMDARQAYYELAKIKQYYRDFKDVDEQMKRAHFLGTNKVLFRMQNATGVPLPPQFEADLTKISLSGLDKQWLTFHTHADTNVFYDHFITVNLRMIDVTPEQVREKHYEEKKEVQDGWDYVLDENGNVMKDTSGNDIKIPRYKILTAYITEVQQHKAARIAGSVDFYDNRTNQLTATYPITADAVFEHVAADVRGDTEAVTEETKTKTGRRPMPFPHDFDLLMQAGSTLKPMVKDVVWNNSGRLQ